MNRPLITIITVCYNAVSTIEKTILSVINQTYTNIEYIIVDGNSNDGTINTIKKYENKISHWISEPDKGIYDAMNKGIKLATGEWINFMNSGDTFYNDYTIEDLFTKTNNKSDIIYGDTNLILKIGNYIKKGERINSHNYMPFLHQSAFARTSLLQKNGFDIKYKICADRNFFYQMYQNKRIFEYINITISNYEAEEGVSATNFIKLHSEIASIEGINNTLKWKIKFFYLKTTYKIKQLLKRILPEKLIKRIKKGNLKRRKNSIIY